MSTPTPRRETPLPVERAGVLTSADRAQVLEACARLGSLPGGLMPVLHAVQERLGWVPEEAVPVIAQALNLSIAEVHGVVSFYHYFRTRQPGRHVLHLCRAEACQSVGAVALEARAKALLGVDLHGTAADGSVTLEPVYCLGNCALGPSVMIDGQLHGRVDERRLEELLGELRAGAAPGRP